MTKQNDENSQIKFKIEDNKILRDSLEYLEMLRILMDRENGAKVKPN